VDARAAIDTIEVNRLLYRFMQSFDEKDWHTMRLCLCDSVFCDYSSFRGTPAGEIVAEEYVARRRSALSELAMQHNILNVNVDVDGDRANARCNYVIHRFRLEAAGSAGEFFHSYGRYVFDLRRDTGEWKIAAIEQILIANRGNPAIHGAFHASGADDQ